MAFEEKGWTGATFEHVAERAGVTRGALNHHFRSKTTLLEEALAWGWAEYGSRLFARDDAMTPSGLLSKFTALLHGDALFRALAACTVLVAPQALSDSSEKNAALDAWREQIAATIPSTYQVAPKTVASLVLVLIQGLTVTAVTRPDDLPQPHELNATISALARGLPT